MSNTQNRSLGALNDGTADRQPDRLPTQIAFRITPIESRRLLEMAAAAGVKQHNQYARERFSEWLTPVPRTADVGSVLAAIENGMKRAMLVHACLTIVGIGAAWHFSAHVPSAEAPTPPTTSRQAVRSTLPEYRLLPEITEAAAAEIRIVVPGRCAQPPASK